MVADIQIDLHNYSCNNLVDSGVVAADFAIDDTHINSYSATTIAVMDSAWDYCCYSRSAPTAMMVTCIDSNWRNFD